MKITPRDLVRIAIAAFLIGVYSWCAAAGLWLATGRAVFFDLSVALAGGAFLSGAAAVVFWSADAIVRAERNMQEVLDRLPALPVAGPYVRDESERLTREAIEDVSNAFARARRCAGEGVYRTVTADGVVVALRKGAAL